MYKSFCLIIVTICWNVCLLSSKVRSNEISPFENLHRYITQSSTVRISQLFYYVRHTAIYIYVSIFYLYKQIEPRYISFSLRSHNIFFFSFIENKMPPKRCGLYCFLETSEWPRFDDLYGFYFYLFYRSFVCKAGNPSTLINVSLHAVGKVTRSYFI